MGTRPTPRSSRSIQTSRRLASAGSSTSNISRRSAEVLFSSRRTGGYCCDASWNRYRWNRHKRRSG
jgi:hypothetical protein